METYVIDPYKRLLCLDFSKGKYTVYYTDHSPVWAPVLFDTQYDTEALARESLKGYYNSYIEDPVRMEEKIASEIRRLYDRGKNG